jgi:hypothetical protein
MLETMVPEASSRRALNQLSDFECFFCRIPGVPEILESGSHVVTL